MGPPASRAPSAPRPLRALREGLTGEGKRTRKDERCSATRYCQLNRDLKSQKLRTLLTVFGLVWGTVAVTLLLAFGAGLKKQLIKTTAGLGDRIVAWPGLTSIRCQGLGKGRRIRVTDEDLQTVRTRVDGFEGDLERVQRRLEDGLQPADVPGRRLGRLPEFGEMRNLIPVPGGRC